MQTHRPRNLIRAARRLILGVTLLVAAGVPLAAHEVETNRLTLVLRDSNHLSLTFFIDYPGALHRALAPTRPFGEFVLMYSAMAPADFEKALARAHARLESGTRLSTPSASLAVTAWRWPSAERAQGLLREIAMAAIVAPADHAHLPPLEVRAEAVAPRGIAELDLRLPAELQEVLVVSYRPNQVVAKPHGSATRVKF